MTTYMFPGQGSQARGMGKELFPKFPDLVETANTILGYSIETLCLEDPQDRLNQTAYTQPALYIINALSYLQQLQQTDGKKPDYVIGHSLGEYNALFAAGVFDFETGLKLVQERGKWMAQASGGAMAAVVGLTLEAVEDILTEHATLNLKIANYNSHTQAVISGLKENILAVQPFFDKAGALFIPLKVSGAFHSPYMEPTKQHFERFLQDFKFQPPTLPVIANLNAQPYPTTGIDGYLAQQITHSVRWLATIQYLMAAGETTFVEVGPGNVLMGLLRRIQRSQ